MGVQARTTYRIETLGGLVVTGGSAPLTGAATQRKTLLLLAVLAAAGPSGVSRDKLIGLLWPDSDAERARHALKQALHILRRDFHDPELIVGTPTVRLNPDVITSDVAEFEELLARDELERAVALHRGPFLDGYYLQGAPEFERWVERERARLAQLHARALERLADAAGAAGDHRGAAAWWRRLAATDPLSSRVAVALMKAQVAAGDPEAALQHARVHEALVRQELETAPDVAVTALAGRVREALRARGAAPDVAAVPAQVESADDAPVAPRDAEPRAPAAMPLVRRGRLLRLAAAVAVVVVVVAGGTVAAVAAARRDDVAPAPAAATAERSVAVLPFADVSGDPANAYFADGLSGEIIAALSHVDGLRVAARTSSFALRDARLDVRAIGDTLGVASVVEGSVRRDGDRLRVTARLIDATTGYHLWAAEYDRKLEDVFAVQDEIAGAIAGALRLPLAGGRGGRRSNPEVYDLYLRGTHLRNRLGRADLLKAITYFDRAIALDSGFALAWAGKASALAPLVYFRHVPRDSGLAALRAATRQALTLDDQLGEAHASMASIHFFYEWDWAAAERELRRAIALDASDALAHHLLANYLRAMERLDESIATRRRSLELDPLNVRTTVAAGGDLAAAGRYDEALDMFRRAADLDSMHPLLLGTGPRLPGAVGGVYEATGRHAEAVAEYVRVAARRGATPALVAEMQRAFAAGGMPAFWRAWLRFEEAGGGTGESRALRLAASHAAAGDLARAVEWLERAYAERDPGLVYLGTDWPWRRLRDEPRIAAMRARMGLPQ